MRCSPPTSALRLPLTRAAGQRIGALSACLEPARIFTGADGPPPGLMPRRGTTPTNSRKPFSILQHVARLPALVNLRRAKCFRIGPLGGATSLP